MSFFNVNGGGNPYDGFRYNKGPQAPKAEGKDKIPSEPKTEGTPTVPTTSRKPTISIADVVIQAELVSNQGAPTAADGNKGSGDGGSAYARLHAQGNTADLINPTDTGSGTNFSTDGTGATAPGSTGSTTGSESSTASGSKDAADKGTSAGQKPDESSTGENGKKPKKDSDNNETWFQKAIRGAKEWLNKTFGRSSESAYPKANGKSTSDSKGTGNDTNKGLFSTLGSIISSAATVVGNLLSSAVTGVGKLLGSAGRFITGIFGGKNKNKDKKDKDIEGDINSPANTRAAGNSPSTASTKPKTDAGTKQPTTPPTSGTSTNDVPIDEPKGNNPFGENTTGQANEHNKNLPRANNNTKTYEPTDITDGLTGYMVDNSNKGMLSGNSRNDYMEKARTEKEEELRKKYGTDVNILVTAVDFGIPGEDGSTDGEKIYLNWVVEKDGIILEQTSNSTTSVSGLDESKDSGNQTGVNGAENKDPATPANKNAGGGSAGSNSGTSSGGYNPFDGNYFYGDPYGVNDPNKTPEESQAAAAQNAGYQYFNSLMDDYMSSHGGSLDGFYDWLDKNGYASAFADYSGYGSGGTNGSTSWNYGGSYNDPWSAGWESFDNFVNRTSGQGGSNGTYYEESERRRREDLNSREQKLQEY